MRRQDTSSPPGPSHCRDAAVRLAVESDGRSWAIRHNDGFLGSVATREQAVAIVHELAATIQGEGGTAELHIAGSVRDNQRSDAADLQMGPATPRLL
jgi:hypothetical protein